MSDVETISVVCPCGKRLKAPVSAAGKKGRCPACGSSVVLSAPDGGDEEDDFGAMQDLVQQAAATPTVSVVVCPQCRKGMDEKAVLCVNCGYNTLTGKAIAAAAPTKATAPVKRGKQIDHMAPDGSLMLGIVLSAVFALAASIVWIVVAWLTGFAIAYIAILIGCAAGIGMQIGHRGYSRAGGIIASGMTILAIFAAKVAVLEIILARKGSHVSLFDLDPAKLGYYFFSPIGLIIIVVGVGAAFRTANGSSSN